MFKGIFRGTIFRGGDNAKLGYESRYLFFASNRSKPFAALAESIGTVSVAGSPIKLQTSIKNLGVYLYSKISFDKQVSETCKACFFHIRALRHIHASLLRLLKP